jgi:hypothetical protein
MELGRVPRVGQPPGASNSVPAVTRGVAEVPVELWLTGWTREVLQGAYNIYGS